MYSKFKVFSKQLAVVAGAMSFSALVVCSTSAVAADKVSTSQVATTQQVAAIGKKFTVQDCALWRGGPGHENDNVPAVYSQHVEVILEFLDNLTINEAMRAIELYCSSTGFAQ